MVPENSARLYLIFLIPAYVIVMDDTCDKITTKDECETAAKELGIIVPIDDAVDGTPSGANADPPGCYIENGNVNSASGGDNLLKFNTDGQNAGLCESAVGWRDVKCICIEGK